MSTQTLTLNNGRTMPLLGLGVYKAANNHEVEQAILTAVEQGGYRMIDTASVYKNEDGVGRAVSSCSIPREELFLTTKVWNTAQRMGDIEGAFNRSLDRMKLDYIDLYLIHWPVPGCYHQTWHELERIYRSGRARSIGVSNFEIPQLEELFQSSGIIPAVNQIEYHPLCVRKDLKAYCQAHGIAIQAYSPLARGAYASSETLIQVGKKYGKSATQTGLRWLVQQNISIIPKSIHVDRIIANSQIFDFSLTDTEMSMIDELDEQFHSSSAPDDMKSFL